MLSEEGALMVKNVPQVRSGRRIRWIYFFLASSSVMLHLHQEKGLDPNADSAEFNYTKTEQKSQKGGEITSSLSSGVLDGNEVHKERVQTKKRSSHEQHIGEGSISRAMMRI